LAEAWNGTAVDGGNGPRRTGTGGSDAKRFGLPPVSITAGRLAFSVAANGVITSLTLHGHVLVNVCAALG
jgi:hypothetical protein